MPRTKKINLRALYFPQRLREKIEGIPDYPITTVIAPAGYGKTTAVADFIRNCCDGYLVLSLRILSDSTADFWQGYCEMVQPLDKSLPMALTELGLPMDAMSRRKFLTLMDAAFDRLEQDVILTLDDYHLLHSDAVDALLSLCAKNLHHRLHLVVLSRNAILPAGDSLRLSGGVHTIEAQDLTFTAEDIEAYFRACGVALEKEQSVELQESSGGWISVIYLNLKTCINTGHFADANNIHRLIEDVIYAPLLDGEKDFLLDLCVLPAFTAPQAEFMRGKEDARKLLADMTENNAFLMLDAHGVYHFHHLLMECVQAAFVALSQEDQAARIERAGAWYLENGAPILAAGYFFRAGDFERLLVAVEADMGRGLNGEHQKDLVNWLEQCPREIQKRHHTALLVFARRFFSSGRPDRCAQICTALIADVMEDASLSEAERNNLLGEAEITLSFLKYNSITGMSVHHRKALSLMTQRNSAINPKASWTFGSPSILYMYYRSPGALAQEVDEMDECMPIYYQLSGDHGRGAEHVMKAEWYFNRGLLDDAELWCHKGLHDASKYGQWSIYLPAVFLQIRMAIFKGDYAYAQYLMPRTRKEIEEAREYMLLHTIDLCSAWIFSLLEQPGILPEWIAAGELTGSRLMHPALPALETAYLQTLLARGEFGAVIAREEDVRQRCRVYPNLLSELYLDLQLTAAYLHYHKNAEARAHLERALDIAMGDALYMPLAELSPLLGELLPQTLARLYPRETKTVLSLTGRYRAARDGIQAEFFPKEETHGLTDRQLEVARLVAAGKSNRDIAEALFIQESSVKNMLNTMYQTLGLKQKKRGGLKKIFSKNEKDSTKS